MKTTERGGKAEEGGRDRGEEGGGRGERHDRTYLIPAGYQLSTGVSEETSDIGSSEGDTYEDYPELH